MIPIPFVFKGANIEEALNRYSSEMPKHLAEFEEKNGPAQVVIVAIYPSGYSHIVVATLYQDKAKLEAIEAAKRVTNMGSGIMDQMGQRLQNIFDSEGCEHEYDSVTDDKGNTKIVCNKCGTPLG